MRLVLTAGLLVLVLGCGASEPSQPKLSDAQVKEIMTKGKGQGDKERGGRGGPGK
ncbi:hypothetical protein GobsT_55610 [Gemmata obscuriglobus]|uniref:hypothetical protein n=1 Tax=Gemmata obscuriglobus TaxID=114 RepID=UPI00016C5110|nr:hypothetical protein [Gemmata obscuriglobus]QEG30749.1 hypothetical protein GobsT_55610 [Gemmata obscuriglobus]VTS10079.1 unnamed protein product [Gemmata obscuriglobus UQM 2246]